MSNTTVRFLQRCKCDWKRSILPVKEVFYKKIIEQSENIYLVAFILERMWKVCVIKMRFKKEMLLNYNRNLMKKVSPPFIVKLLFNKKSMLTSINYWYVIKGLLLWLIENNLINKDSISEITPEDMQGIDASDINMYLKSRELGGISPTTLYAHRNIFSAFWQSMEKSPTIPVTTNIIQDVAYRGIASVNNLYVKMPKEEDLVVMEEKIKKNQMNSSVIGIWQY